MQRSRKDDMMDQNTEYFDLYDEVGQPLGRSKARDEVHRDGDWHRSAHVWIVTGLGELLFQRRGATKDTWPGTLDATAGGHYRAGEGWEAVVREIEEELGVEVDAAELVSLGQRRVDSRELGVVDREIQDVFVVRRDAPLTAYRLDPAEVDGLAALPIAQAALLHADVGARAEARYLARGGGDPAPLTMTAGDIIPGRAAYLAAVADAARALLAGEAVTPLPDAAVEVIEAGQR